MKKFTLLLLTAVLAFSFCVFAVNAQDAEPAFIVADNDEDIYFNPDNYGEIYDTFMKATTEAGSIAERYALLAISEAKALESGVAATMYGGSAAYNMTHIVKNSGGYAPWRGSMSDTTQMIVTNEVITTEDNNYLNDLWVETIGTGTYIEKAKAYMAEKGYTFKENYSSTFSDNPTTWDIFAAATSNDSGIIGPTYDYLFAYDPEGVMQPHLAESYEMSEDGTVYTFKIRPGQIWVDSQGRKVADVTADDWVAAAQHAADLQDAYTLSKFIAGFNEYMNGETTDFGTVGIKALDDLTLEYTLKEPCTYFLSLTQTNQMVPLCRNYFLSQGGAFGLSEFAEASAQPSYVYGIDQDHIAICGMFLCTNMTEKNSITYVLNESYWNAANANFKGVKLIFSDSSDVNRVYEDFMNGNTVSMYLNAERLEMAKQRGDFEKYAYVNDVGRITFMFMFNLNRQTYANMADGAGASSKTEEQKELSRAAMQNRHFRLAVGYSINRETYLAQNVGVELAMKSVRNSWIPGTYVFMPEEVTVDINGTPTTFPEGTWFGEIVQAQLTADEWPIVVWDQENLTNDGWDAWYRPDLAKEEFAIAVEELKTLGFEVSAENPIIMDYPYPDYNEVGQNQAFVLKTCIEAPFDGMVIFDTIPLNNNTEFWNVQNNTNAGSEVNTDFCLSGANGSDHGDPSCYIDGVLPYGDGWLIDRAGMF